jgi:RHS repeat-associated core domain
MCDSEDFGARGSRENDACPRLGQLIRRLCSPFMINSINCSTPITDEIGNKKTQVYAWSGKVLKQSQAVSGTTYTTMSFFDGAGRVIGTIDANDNGSTIAYNALGLKSAVGGQARSVAGSMVTPELVIDYNPNGTVLKTTQVIDAGTTRATSYTTNGIGEVVQTETSVGSGGSAKTLRVTNAYDAVGNITTQTSGYDADYSAKTTKSSSWSYDSHSRVLTKTIGSGDSSSETTSYSYDAMGNRTSVTDPRQKRTTANGGSYTASFVLTLQYDQLGRLIEADLPYSADASNKTPTTKYLYDARGKLVKRQEADGEVRSYAYTPRSLLSSSTITDTDGTAAYTTKYAYNEAGLTTSTTTPSGRVDYFEYDEAGHILRQGNYTLGFTSYSYDGNGNVVSKRDGRTDIDGTVRYSYTVDNLIASVTDAKGNATTMTYDRWGQRLSSSDANGNTRSYSYDELGRVVAETTPLGASMSYVYDAWGNAISQTDARGNVFSRNYNAENHMTSETARSADGSQIQTTSYSYDEGGDLKASDNGVRTEYNLSGGVYQADPYDLTTAKTTSIGSSSVAMAFAYDERQRITKESYADASSVNYHYNKLDQLTSLSDGAGASIGALSYDAYGRLQTLSLSSGIGKAFAYDTQDRLAGLTYSAGTSELADYSLKYDLASNIVEKNSNTYSYDAVNQLVGSSENGWFQKKPADISPQYTVADRDYSGSSILQFDSTKISQTSELKLDTASRSVGVDLGQEYGVNMIELHPKATNTPEWHSRVRQQDLAVYVSSDNGTSTSATSGYQQVTGWRLTTNSDGSMLITFAKIETVRYIKVNTIWDDRDIDNESVDDYATFTNKAIDLVKVWVLSTYQTRNYSYDAIGNISSLNKDGSSQRYDYYTNSSGKPLNLLKKDADWYYDYDKAGNRILKAKAISSGTLGSVTPDTSKEYWNYTWDLYNRLSTATQTVDGVAKTVSYTYDAENFRVQRTDSSGTVVYGYDRNAALAYEKNLTTGLTRTITYVNGIIVGWTDTDSSGTTTKYNAVTDNLGSVTKVTDASGKILWQSEYTPYGEVAGAEGSIDFDGMYTGQDIDPFTGLTYHWNRWRSEDGTRFVSEDPAQDGINWYSYAGNNPLRFTDPSGLDAYDFYSGLESGTQDTDHTSYENAISRTHEGESGYEGSVYQHYDQQQIAKVNGQGGIWDDVYIDDQYQGRQWTPNPEPTAAQAAVTSAGDTGSSSSFGSWLGSQVSQNLLVQGALITGRNLQLLANGAYDLTDQFARLLDSRMSANDLFLATGIPGVSLPSDIAALGRLGAGAEAGVTTDFLSDVTVVSKGKVVGQGTVDLRGIISDILSGDAPVRDIFQNREGLLPVQPSGYYKEFTVPTPGVSGAGSQRIIQGAGGELYYTPNHYGSFVPLN